MERRQIMKICCSFIILLMFPFVLNGSGSKDLVASMAQLPGLVETPDKGAFVDLVKAIDEVYTDGTITIKVYPFKRSVQNVIDGRADFHVPTLRNPAISEQSLPYRTVKESMGTVVFVLYSNVDKKLTKEMVRKSNYIIEAPGGLEGNFQVKVVSSNDLNSSMLKLKNKRIDAVLWAQEEADLVIKRKKIKEIHRFHYANFDDAIIIPKGPEGNRIDKIISNALRKLKKSGRHRKLYYKIHRPYNGWQPAQMGW